MFNTRMFVAHIASPSIDSHSTTNSSISSPSIANAFIASTAALTLALVVCSGCARSETREHTRREAAAPATAQSGGTIEGRIHHPAHVIPPMRICAIGSGAPDEAKHLCVQTRRDQASYRITGVPADDYIVIAHTQNGVAPYRIGGHMQQVQCIRAPCPEMPASVNVGENAHVDGIDINQFYDKRDDFPALRQK
jgi:hypothetical protein